ncbi:TRAF interacting protein TANK isoform X2 [Xenopus laevis]|nr:TRAF interacting protein TANK isoform X2 [Xenopus laevis]XP_041431664.1 TRAF interacting protein TANK isoform X2 [Xenopus laevis]XP_041431665.1 TRAF interacting protein TANK isoform X2 [Xenopus laevis]XP_041431666.1 TRAF interacting protein TANK isoform X2 [Xenopus laevis]XP_041431667.1 TRAF interacting protein TANK isoform X2 [Xenopus laevis]XP_041431668.1 TRAF interacting protein TANK isoform X2 [Xenopus laevis]AAI70368.1 TRAF family member-associated NF-kappaB activator [Xenopus laevis]
MEINIGEQLNKAYEAYRQACMDKEQAVKQMQQKLDACEQQLRDQSKQIAGLKNCITVLTSQPSTASNPGKGGVHAPPQSPKPGSTEGWRNEGANSFSYEHLQEELRVSMQREKHYKEQLENERFKLRKLEESQKAFESFVHNKNGEIKTLKILLKQAIERHKSEDNKLQPALEGEVKSKTLQDSTGAVSALDCSRQGIEQIFSEMKEEFSHICRLTRKQSLHLNTFLLKKENSSEIPLQCSMPIQCTDEQNEEEQDIASSVKSDKSSFGSITPRGLGADDESIFVESLSEFSVKFPPNDDDSEFLQSNPEKLHIPVLTQHPNQLHTQAPILINNLSTKQPNTTDTHHLTGGSCNLETVNHADLGNNYRGSNLQTAEDSDLLQAVSSPVRKYTNTFYSPEIQDAPESAETPGRTVRGPHQDVWKPVMHQEKDLPAPGYRKWDQNSSDVCEFCKAVFPTARRSHEDFFRHLNSHFNDGQPRTNFLE